MEVDKQRIAELVGKVQNGDNSAFDELYKLTSERAYFVALEFTKNNQDAEDILQESYIKALSKIKELDKPESFSSWLNQIVANKSKDFLKKKKPTLFEAEENEVFEVLPDEDTSFSPEENLDQNELQKTVMEVLDELSEEKRACVLMMYFEELSVGEIAETLEIPEGTVKTRLFSARKDLKDKFAKRGITSTFSFAPIGVVIWAMRRMSDAVSKTFVSSGASAKVLTDITVAGTGTAASVAGTTAVTTAATAGTGTATTAVVSGTSVAAKIAAMTVAQKVIAGVSVAAVLAGGTVGVVTVVNDDDKKDDISTTAYTEEYTTAPSFETTLAVEALGTVEFSESTVLSSDGSTGTNRSTSNNSSTKLQSTTVKTTSKSTTSAKHTTTQKQTTTTKEQTATTTKATTTKKETTTKATTTEEETTTKKVITTKETTTEKQTTTTQPTTTTTKPTTTEATTKGTATIILIAHNPETGAETSVELSFAAGETITEGYLDGELASRNLLLEGTEYPTLGYGGDYDIVAEAGQTYTIHAYL